MRLNSCSKIQAAFSEYLDGAVTGHEMQQIRRHMDGSEGRSGCSDCTREFAAWRSIQECLGMLRPAKAPVDLSLKLRLAISHEQARRNARWLDSVSLLWDNTVRPTLVHFSAGIAATVLLVGSIVLMMGLVAPQQAVLADDEPLLAITAPRYMYSAVLPGAIVTDRDATIIVEASVDNHGRVYDYKIVSGPQDDATRSQVVNQLLLSVFQPASVFGVPVRGRVVMTYSGISVRG